jgi:hypothetical protein
MLRAAIASYAKAMGLQTGAVQVTSRAYTGAMGAPLTALVTPDGTPLLLRTAPANWTEANLGPLATAAGIILETMVYVDPAMTQSYVEMVTSNANSLIAGGELDMSWVFGRFTRAHWDRLIADWPAASAQLKGGTLPQPYPYEWGGIDGVLRFASGKRLSVRAFHLASRRR